MSCAECYSLTVAEGGRCLSCGARYTRLWDGGRVSMYIYLGANGAALLIILALWVFWDAGQGTAVAAFLFFLLSVYTTYRLGLGVMDLFSGRRMYRGRVTDISDARLVDLFAGSDLRLRIDQRRFKLEELPIRQLRKGQEVLVLHTPGTKTITRVYGVTEEAEPPPRRRRARMRGERR